MKLYRAENIEHYSDEQLLNDSRCLQDMIFDNRASSPLIPDKLYLGKEIVMNKLHMIQTMSS